MALIHDIVLFKAIKHKIEARLAKVMAINVYTYIYEFPLLFFFPVLMNNFISIHKNKSIIMSFIVSHEIYPKTNFCG